MREASEVVSSETNRAEAEDAPMLYARSSCVWRKVKEKWAERLSKSYNSCNSQRILQKVDIDTPSARNWCLWWYVQGWQR